MKTSLFAPLAGVMVLLCPNGPARADSPAEASAAAAVFRTMHDDLERCFVGTNENAYVRVEALVDERGRVRRVEATGNARATPATRRCIGRRVMRAVFPAPRGGGTSRVRTSLVYAVD